jgi:5-methylthioadenosine/S-adenosylhomocysteine deaminase
MERVDYLIYNGTVLTMDAAGTSLESGGVAVKDGRIVDLGPDVRLRSCPAGQTLDARGGIIMPGLVNAHTHLPMSLFRGLADDLPLEQWLNEHIFPAEAAHIRPDSVALGARLSAAEMLLGGTTTCCDGYFLAHWIAEAVEEVGLRAVLGQGVIDFPAPGVADPKENIQAAKAFVLSWQGRSEKIRPSIFCHAPYTCSAETLRAAKQAAEEQGVLFQIHVAETRSETRRCREAHGCSPIQYLDRLGVLNRRTLLVHAVWADETDIRIIGEQAACVAHCPESNMKLASGIAPIPDMLAAGVPVALGTDGCASNNDLDLWGEMDAAAKLHKVQRLDSTVMDAGSVLRMATIEGARAIGLDQEIGSLEIGKQADLIVIDTNQPHLAPMYHPRSHLVYAVHAADVRHVLIAGRPVVQDRQLQTIDRDALIREVRRMGGIISGAQGGNIKPKC